jgi:predicted nucleic acid-binding protein
VTASLGEVRIVTTEEVLVEFLNALSGGSHLRRAAVELVARMRSSGSIEVLPQSPESLTTRLSLYTGRPDKTYSMTDCISMSAMQERGRADARPSLHARRIHRLALNCRGARSV